VRTRALGLAAVLAAVACAHSSRPASGVAVAAPPGAISAEDLRARVALIADDSMGGRFPGERGNIEVTDYVAAEFQRFGLTPAGDRGGYFQFVPFVSTIVDTTRTIMVGDTPLVLWRDIVPVNSSPSAVSFTAAGTTVVYEGQLGDTAVHLSADSVAGRLVVFALGRTRDGAPDYRSTRFLPRDRLARAAAIMIIYPGGVPAATAMALRGRRFTVPRPATAAPFPLLLLAGEAAGRLVLGDAPASVVVGTVRHPAFTGSVAFRAPDTLKARNVVAILPGADPAHRGEYVAIGAHNDHVGTAPFGVDHDSLRAYNILLARGHYDGPAAGNPGSGPKDLVVNVDSLRRIRPPRRDSIFNGADDDGSGTASLVAIARAFATAPTRPKRSILFVSHAGEEQGLLGSRWYADHPTVPRDSIVAYLNMDMLGHGDSADVAGGGPRYVQSGGARRLSREYGALIDSVNAGLPEPLAIDYSWDAPGHPSQKYCRSDHQSYARYGIPVAYFSTGYSVDYHQLTDEPQYLDYPHMARVARLVYAVARAVADLDHRPLVDQPRPDPDAPCRQ